MRPYLGLLVALKQVTRRLSGIYIKFDENRMFTFTEPTKFGAHGKTSGIPNLLGTKAFGPACIEFTRNKKTREKFMAILMRTGGIV